MISLGHSDPVKLKESAEDVQRLSASELQKRQLELKVIIFSNNKVWLVLLATAAASKLLLIFSALVLVI